MRYYIEHLPMTIPMGVQSENNAEAVEFDVSDWLARDGSLSFSVWVTRPGETEAYQAANATLKDGILYWWPTGADTAIAGEGRVEILAVSANRRMLSGWTATSIRETTTETTTDAPVDQRPWLDQALLASEEAKAAATSAAASADQAEGVVKKEIATLTQEMVVVDNRGKAYTDGVAIDYMADLEIGTMENDGTKAESNLRVRTANFHKIRGKEIRVVIPNTDYRVELYFYDGDYNFISLTTYITESKTLTVPEKAEYVILLFAQQVGYVDYTNVGMPTDIEIDVIYTELTNGGLYAKTLNTMPKLRVMAYNARCYRGGLEDADAPAYNVPLTNEQIETTLQRFKGLLAKYNPDVLVVSEDRLYFDGDCGIDSTGLRNVYGELFEHYYPYHFNIEMASAEPTIYSKYPITDAKRISVSYPDTTTSGRYTYPPSVGITVQGYQIYIVGAHPMSDPSAYESNRVPYHQAIVDFAADKEYVVVLGDLNHDTENPASEVAVYTENDFTLGNLGYFGEFATYDANVMNVLDNIVVKGMTMGNFVVGTEKYSDHFPVYSDLNVRI